MTRNNVRVFFMRNDERLLTVSQFTTAYPWPSRAAIRNYIATAERSRFPFHRKGRRVLLRPSEIDKWATDAES